MSFDLQRAKVASEDHLRCTVCGGITHRTQLSDFGARCQPCYEKYLADRNPSWYPAGGLTPEQRAAVIRRARHLASKIGKGSDELRTPAEVCRDNLLAIRQKRPLTQAQADVLKACEKKAGMESQP